MSTTVTETKGLLRLDVPGWNSLREFRFVWENDRQTDYRSGGVFTTNKDTPSVTYERESWYPYFGVRFYSPRDWRFGYELRGMYSDFLTVNDRDDHVERNKLSTSDLDQGQAMLGKARGYWRLTRSTKFFVGIGYNYYQASGKQHQRWYGNDPLTESNDTGKTATTNIDVEDEKTSYSAGLRYSW